MQVAAAPELVAAHQYKNKEEFVSILKEGSTVACHECDLLVTLPNLERVKLVACPRCEFVITRFHKFSLERGFSFVMASLVFCLIANLFPFLTISTAFSGNTISLVQSINILIEMGEYVFAILFATMILLFPLMVLSALLYMLSGIYFKKPLPKLVLAYKAIFYIKEWAMAEVFLIGTFVSLVKVVSIARVELEIGFWAYILFAVLMSMALNSVDKLQSWRVISALTTVHTKIGS